MKLNSKYFDSIRVKPEDDRREKEAAEKMCDWPGCDKKAKYPAPKGRGRDGEYLQFCLKHVRQYNKSYNYFNGMSDNQVEEFQDEARHGHRPTWSMGGNSWAHGKQASDNQENIENAADISSLGNQARMAGKGAAHAKLNIDDPFELFEEATQSKNKDKQKNKRPVRKLERKSLQALNLSDEASPEDIKTRFKALAKRHHPDLNGGDKNSEDRLREIIQAYNYLKQAGLC